MPLEIEQTFGLLPGFAADDQWRDWQDERSHKDNKTRSKKAGKNTSARPPKEVSHDKWVAKHAAEDRARELTKKHKQRERCRDRNDKLLSAEVDDREVDEATALHDDGDEEVDYDYLVDAHDWVSHDWVDDYDASPSFGSPTGQLNASPSFGSPAGQLIADWQPEQVQHAAPQKAMNRVRQEFIALRRLQRRDPEMRPSYVDHLRIVPDEDDMCRMYVVLQGPDDTVYEGGLFVFYVVVTDQYPAEAPRVKLLTTQHEKVRFNPNLYANGKVCISTLGTWHGEGWNESLTLTDVFQAILFVMSGLEQIGKIVFNEPGIRATDEESLAYDEVIRHEVIRVAILGMHREESIAENSGKLSEGVCFEVDDMAMELSMKERLLRAESYCLERVEKDGEYLTKFIESVSGYSSVVRILMQGGGNGGMAQRRFQWRVLAEGLRALINERFPPGEDGEACEDNKAKAAPA